MDDLTSHFKNSSQRVILQLKEDLKTIRTGKANPALIEGIMVETYGGQTKLKILELATVTTEGASTIAVQPFDPSTTADIEKAILKSPIGLTPAPQGGKLLVKIPPLSQEQREKMMKLINQMIEEKKVIIRNMRDDVRKKIKTMQENKEITEDDKFRKEKEIDTLTQQLMEDIQTIKDHKEQEIKEI